MYHDTNKLIEIAGSEEALNEVFHILKAGKLGIESYADIFTLLHHTLPDDSDKLIYIQIDKEWHRDKKKMTDAKIFGLLNETCEFIRLYIRNSWEESLFSAWMTDKPLRKMEKQMDEMETLPALQAILNKAAENMSSVSGKIRWEDEAASEDSEDDEETED